MLVGGIRKGSFFKLTHLCSVPPKSTWYLYTLSNHVSTLKVYLHTDSNWSFFFFYSHFSFLESQLGTLWSCNLLVSLRLLSRFVGLFPTSFSFLYHPVPGRWFRSRLRTEFFLYQSKNFRWLFLPPVSSPVTVNYILTCLFISDGNTCTWGTIEDPLFKTTREFLNLYLTLFNSFLSPSPLSHSHCEDL